MRRMPSAGRRLMPRTTTIVVAALAAAAAAGCTRPALSDEDYQRRTAEICAETERSERALGEPRTDADVVPLLRRVRALHRRETERIARLNPPLDWEERHNEAVEVGVDEDRAAQRLIVRLERSPRPRAELLRSRDEWRRLGVHYGRRLTRRGGVPGCAARRSRSLLP
jgi:hypothetical protein